MTRPKAATGRHSHDDPGLASPMRPKTAGEDKGNQEQRGTQTRRKWKHQNKAKSKKQRERQDREL